MPHNNRSHNSTQLVGYCRICNNPILRTGPTCQHTGYLIYEPYQTYWRGSDGSVEHHRSMSPLGHYVGPDWPEATQDSATIIADILAAAEEAPLARIVNASTINPCDIRQGDTMMFVVKATVVAPGRYRIYRCAYEGDDIPQGSRISLEDIVAQVIFPSLAQVAEPDLY